jgi:hypothetical protein
LFFFLIFKTNENVKATIAKIITNPVFSPTTVANIFSPLSGKSGG